MKLIDKDRLEEFLNELIENLGDSDFDRGYLCAINSIFGCYLESIEAKEVGLDFEQELYKSFGQVKDFTLGMRIAKHFFELGMSVSNKAQKGE